MEMRKWLKSLLGAAVFGLGLHRALLKGYGIIVAFHRTNDAESGNEMTCNSEDFLGYCDFFRNHFRVISLSEFVDGIRQGTLRGGELSITLDDGYRDNFECAAPILSRTKLPATFFVITEMIGTQETPWWDESRQVEHPFMSWEEVQALHAQGFEIGSHTCTHPDLGLSQDDVAKDEIEQSLVTLRNRIDVPSCHFAYPYGATEHITERARAMVESAGYHSCSGYGDFNTVETSPFHLNRIPISSWYVSPLHFAGDLVIKSLKRRMSPIANG